MVMVNLLLDGALLYVIGKLSGRHSVNKKQIISVLLNQFFWEVEGLFLGKVATVIV